VAINRRSFVERALMLLGASGVSVPLEAKAKSLGLDQPATGVGQSGARPYEGGGYIRPGTIETIHRSFDVVVVGGGISGTCAAISAARNGVQVALVHERSTLGGNSSSEVRLYPEDTCSFSPWIKESGILEEMEAEERASNWEPRVEGIMNSQWDLVLYEWAKREKTLSLFLNTTMREVVMRDKAHIQAIHAAQLGTEREFILSAPIWIDATGDGVLAYRAGADFRWGRETKSEYQEVLAPTEPTTGTMGNTLFFRARDTGKPISFRRPDWAAEFKTEQDLTQRGHGNFECGYWWIEVGTPLHPIKDNEEIRDEALRQLLGVWDHIKNHCTDDSVRERAKNFALEFVGFWPYKRESRRILGDYTLTEKDVRYPSIHADDIAYGSWGIDIHIPGGIQERHVPPYPGPRSDENFKQYGTIPYGIPLRSCYSRNIQNLLTAGRPIGASYVAFASSRVLPTGAIVGQGVGVAAALCTRHKCEPKDVVANHAFEMQQILLRQDASIPGVVNADPADLARRAQVTASGEASLHFPESDVFHKVRFPLGQAFPVTTDRVDGVELLMRSTSTQSQTVTLTLRSIASVWDLRSTPQIASASASVSAGFKGYVSFPLHAATKPGSLYFISIDAQPELAWAMYSDQDGHASQVPVGTTAADLAPGNIWRPFTRGRSFAMKVLPEQRPYGPENVIRGTNRPDRWSNAFVSVPLAESTAWLELRFPAPVKMSEVQLTFDTDTNRRIELPLFRYPECVKHYEIAVPQGGGWKTIAEEDNNYQRRRVHRFDAVTATRLRINLLETNGSPQARVFEVRVYGEASNS
jgi:hypothetical protein